MPMWATLGRQDKMQSEGIQPVGQGAGGGQCEPWGCRCQTATPPRRFFPSSVNQTLVETVRESPRISPSSEDPGKKAEALESKGQKST